MLHQFYFFSFVFSPVSPFGVSLLGSSNLVLSAGINFSCSKSTGFNCCFKLLFCLLSSFTIALTPSNIVFSGTPNVSVNPFRKKLFGKSATLTTPQRKYMLPLHKRHHPSHQIKVL